MVPAVGTRRANNVLDAAVLQLLRTSPFGSVVCAFHVESVGSLRQPSTFMVPPEYERLLLRHFEPSDLGPLYACIETPR
jgi:hypothetical protein